jgi:hypothetical protein
MSKSPVLVASNEDAARVPADQPVTFRLKPEQVPDIPGPAGASDLGPPPPASMHPLPPSSSSPVRTDDLEEQINNLRQSERVAQQRAMQAETYARNAANYLQTQQMRGQLAETRDELERGMQNAHAELEAAKANYSVAISRGDHNAAADHMAEMTAAQHRMQVIQDGQDEFVEHVQGLQQQQQRPQKQAPQLTAQNVGGYIDTQMPALLPSEKEWLKQHPDAILDPANQQRLNIAFHDSVRSGLKRGTPEYFRFFDDRLNYDPNNDWRGGREPNDPVSRLAASEPEYSEPTQQRRQKTSREVTLTKEEREMAKLSGISEEEYGIGKLRLQEYKRRGMYQEN